MRLPAITPSRPAAAATAARPDPWPDPWSALLAPLLGRPFAVLRPRVASAARLTAACAAPRPAHR